jgi:RsiW-degrading membrane proteinase PrsW (M82 family)
MIALALAIAPGLAICLFIYSRDRFNREPPRYLIMSFVLGTLSTIPALILEILGGDFRSDFSNHSILSYAAYAYGVVACSEELSKFIVLRFYDYPKKSFD